MNEYDILYIGDTPNGDNMTLANYFDYEIGLQDLLAALHEPTSIELGTKALEVVSRVCALGIKVQAPKANARALHKDETLGDEEKHRNMVDVELQTTSVTVGLKTKIQTAQ